MYLHKVHNKVYYSKKINFVIIYRRAITYDKVMILRINYK